MMKFIRKLRAADAWEIGLRRFSVVGIKAVIIEECHHMLQPGPGKDEGVGGLNCSIRHPAPPR